MCPFHHTCLTFSRSLQNITLTLETKEMITDPLVTFWVWLVHGCLLALMVIEVSYSWDVESAVTHIKLYYKAVKKRYILSCTVNWEFQVVVVNFWGFSFKLRIFLKYGLNQADFVHTCSDAYREKKIAIQEPMKVTFEVPNHKNSLHKSQLKYIKTIFFNWLEF